MWLLSDNQIWRRRAPEYIENNPSDTPCRNSDICRAASSCLRRNQQNNLLKKKSVKQQQQEQQQRLLADALIMIMLFLCVI